MAKGDSGPTRKQRARRDWVRGPGKVTRGRGKDTGTSTTSYDMNYKPSASQKTGIGDVKAGRQYEGGSNQLDREKTLSYDEKLAAGSAADDPRNWQFHYKAPGGRYSDTKGMTARERRDQAYSSARSKAEKNARLAGESLYDIKKLEHKTQAIKDESKQATADAKAGRRFGSSKTSTAVAAQRQLAMRKSGRGGMKRAGSVGVFDAPVNRSRRMT